MTSSKSSSGSNTIKGQVHLTQGQQLSKWHWYHKESKSELHLSLGLQATGGRTRGTDREETGFQPTE